MSVRPVYKFYKYSVLVSDDAANDNAETHVELNDQVGALFNIGDSVLEEITEEGFNAKLKKSVA